MILFSYNLPVAIVIEVFDKLCYNNTVNKLPAQEENYYVPRLYSRDL